ncbi:spondin domain-containing protein [Draconibacterium sp. IB214405]|uniref:spondin domain-containing protein n=1 Tax=Draconibacterium sp. IB214405 TaxID=3097352 RepID=UPI002A0D7006|nr:spondin domain-containing protein [Draconibacterium sp. IB214405]MDX8338390.1 spondin domain-containing protein [Draconibacterium sp. IB214405]
MKALRFTMVAALAVLLFTQCEKDEMMEPETKSGTLPDVVPAKMYTITVENVSVHYNYFEAGAEFGVTGGDAAPPAHPGETITVNFHAGPNHKLSFASMYGASNDWFYSPGDDGIELFPGGSALEGDITNMIYLWDAGTEVDGSTSDEEESNPIGMVSTTEENIQVLLDYSGESMFTLTINVLPGSATPLSPVAWVVHSMDQHPIFMEGELDYGMGLEALAETGNAGPLGEYLEMHSGYVSPIAPVLWAVHEKDEMPIFTNNTPDRGEGLELLAETGNPGDLAVSLVGMGYNAGAYAIPDGGNSAGPLFPGDKYTFSIDAKPNQYLSIASMLGNSNDIFFAFGDSGIKLNFGNADQDITDEVMLWDAGTEVNEYPGTKSMDEDEGGVVRLLDDGFTYPDVNKIIKVTIRKSK